MGDSDANTVVERPGGDRSEPRDDKRAPTELPERYVAGEEIARGGMGRVLEATDTLLGRTVAVKQALALDHEALRRFQRETMITARLEHPSIVPVYDAGTNADGTPFYVMRKVSGRPLDKLVKEAESLNQRLALLPQIVCAAQAVAHAHERGVIHRDIKPANILVDSRGETIVIDWGLAKVIGEADALGPQARPPLDAGSSIKTHVGTVLGTAGFMSPEQLRTTDIDARSDVYALGATLYYVLARRPPHVGQTSEEVMLAAATAPPPPIASVVDGVPAELATICDKALAYDDRVRYANAGELAVDLGMFLAGQVVASHHYTAFEKLVRFVRKNRVSVAIFLLALLAVIIVARIALVRVLDARDEAVSQRRVAESMREREATRANEVTLGQARLLLDSNPTAAVALVKPLARSEHWREVRAIATEAQALGVTWKLPSSPRMRSIAMTPDGLHAVAASEEGAIWFYDLRARTGFTVAELDRPWITLVALDDARVLAFDKTNRAVLIDVVTRKRSDLPLDAPIAHAVAHAGNAWFVDRNDVGWKLAAGSTTPERIEIADKIVELMPGPDGSQLAASGRTGLWLLAGGAPEKLVSGRVFHSAWSDDGTRIGALVDDSIVDVQLVPERHTSRVRAPAQLSIAIVANTNYTAGMSGVMVDGMRPAGWNTGTYVQGLHPTRGGAVVTSGGSDGTLSVISKTRRHNVRSPLVPVQALAASPRSHFALSISRYNVLLWDLSAIVPVQYDAKADSTVALGNVGPHGLIAAHPQSPSHWIDLATGKREPGPELPLAYGGIDSPSGKTLFVFAFDGRATLVRTGTTEIVPVADDIESGLLIDDERLIAGSRSGEIRFYDLTAKTHTVLAKGKGEVLFLRAPALKRTWALAGFPDGMLWRIDVATKRADTWMATDHKWERRNTLITADGRAWFGDGTTLRCWRTDGSVVAHATLPDRIVGVFDVDDRRLLAYTSVGDSYFVDLSKPEQLEPTIALSDYNVSTSATAGLLAFPHNEGGLVVLDQIANASFRLARILKSTDYPSLTRDGRYIYTKTEDTLSVWAIALPATAQETAAWLDALTNASTGRGTALTWQ